MLGMLDSIQSPRISAKAVSTWRWLTSWAELAGDWESESVARAIDDAVSW